MFETIKKARHLAAIALERVDDYLELLRISLEIQGHSLKKRIISFVIVVLFAVLGLIFFGLAIIVTCWDTPYRTAAAWGVAACYALIAFVAYIGSQDKTRPASTFDALRDELRQDAKLMKDVV
ncbi:phage holin family protein [Nitrosospira lacus]|uniref:Phage holin family protein n=1 Tax=Nitrosospira lacus TaxID=1288494 RepID=A0A1W6SN66_9PROT|nr:phage holin family protein [Nitrosospira lacus]ARO87250.1 phage holin family protein [Nitrosospira lacus]